MCIRDSDDGGGGCGGAARLLQQALAVKDQRSYASLKSYVEHVAGRCGVQLTLRSQKVLPLHFHTVASFTYGQTHLYPRSIVFSLVSCRRDVQKKHGSDGRRSLDPRQTFIPCIGQMTRDQTCDRGYDAQSNIHSLCHRQARPIAPPPLVYTN